jgi:hypothetical protein
VKDRAAVGWKGTEAVAACAGQFSVVDGSSVRAMASRMDGARWTPDAGMRR